MEVPQEVKDVLPGVLGSAVALRWYARHGAWPAATMFIGGIALSYFGTEHVARYFSLTGAIGLTGFLLGMLGMTLVSKVYELIDRIDVGELWSIVRDWIARRFGQ